MGWTARPRWLLGRAFRCGLAALAFGCGGGAAPPLPEPERFADDSGVQELVASRVEMCRRRPRDAESWLRLGIALEANGRPADAEAYFRHALALDPRSPRAEYRLAATLEVLGRTAEAAAGFGRAARLAPRSPLPERRRGAALLAQGDFAGARQAFALAEKLGDGLPSTVGLARVDLETESPQAARERLEPFAHLAASWPELAATLAAALRACGEHERAAALIAAPQARVAWPDAWDEELRESTASLAGGLERAAAELALGQAAVAVDRLERLRSRYGERGPILALLGGAYLAASRLAEAERTLAAARQAGPEHYALVLNSAALELLLGRPANGLPWALRAIELQPDAPKARELAGTILAGMGRLEEAAGHFEHARRQTPNDLPTLLRAAEMQARLGRWSEASETYRAARALAPLRGDLALAEAQCAAMAGDRVSAESALAEAARLGVPGDALTRAGALLRRPMP